VLECAIYWHLACDADPEGFPRSAIAVVNAIEDARRALAMSRNGAGDAKPSGTKSCREAASPVSPRRCRHPKPQQPVDGAQAFFSDARPLFQNQSMCMLRKTATNGNQRIVVVHSDLPRKRLPTEAAHDDP